MTQTLPHLAPGALSDVRVIELGQLLAGPYCGQLLGDHGAEVIKVEDPATGDPMREWGREKAQGESLWWPIVARNKKSVTANLRTPEGQQIIKDLVADADMLLENFRPGTLEKWGLGYDVLSEINPGLILIRVSGFGQTGPYAPRPGYASIGEAMGGLRYVVGDPDRPPSRCGISLGDSLAATFAALGALSALHHRDVTGRGQIVDASIYESVFAYMESLIPEWDIGHYQRERTGSTLPNVSPSNVYPTKDGDTVLIAANMDTVFRRLAAAMDMPELAEDERYATHSARGAHGAELDDIIAQWSMQWNAEDLLAHLTEKAIPSGRVYTAKDIMDDPHYKAREAIIRVPHPTLGDFPMQNVFPFLSETPGEVKWVGAELGQHSDEVYTELLGFDTERLADYRERGII
jgi:formyl-CoA transferase